MWALAMAAELDFLVVASLNGGPRDGAVRVQPRTIDILDIRGAPPARHQSARRGAAVFVRENYGVLKQSAAIFDEPLAIREQWYIVETANRIGARIKNGSMRQRHPVRIVRSHLPDMR